MRRSFFSSRHMSHDEEALINLTPLIDVVFVVLIMFIVIAPMLEIDKVELASAAKKEDASATIAEESSPITIHVRKDNTICLNTKVVSQEALLQTLIQLRKAYPHKTPQLFHDKNAYFGTYQTVKNAVETAGFLQLDVVLTPE